MPAATLDRKLAAIVALLRQQKEEYGSFERLADAIKVATVAPRHPIDRRKLADLVAASPDRLARIHLTLREVAALDEFLLRRGGLTRVMKLRSVIEAAADPGRVTFLVGNKPIDTADRHGIDYVSRWDLHAFTFLLRAIDRVRPNVQIDIVDIPLVLGEQAPAQRRAAARDSRDLVKVKQRLKSLLLDPQPAGGVICCGSPRACHAAEFMLAIMFGLSDFEPHPHPAELPFSYLVSRDVFEQSPSCFASLADQSPAAAALPKDGPVRGIQIHGEVIPLDQSGDHWRSFGVCVAQRRANGSTWLVLGGASGPATLACAQQAELMAVDWHPDDRADSPPAWMAVAAEVERTTADAPDRRGDHRSVRATHIYENPKTNLLALNLAPYQAGTAAAPRTAAPAPPPPARRARGS